MFCTMSARAKASLGESTVRELSVLASCDPRSLRKVLRGESVLPMTRARVVKVLAERNLLHLVPAEHTESVPAKAAG
jgi:hypothetical protein